MTRTQRSTIAAVLVLIAIVIAPLQAFAAAPVASLNGGGQGLLSDPDGNLFPIQFAFAGSIDAGGGANGHINFVFKGEMANYYGLVPGEDTLHVYGQAVSGSVGPDGLVTIRGTVTAVDFNNGDGIIGIVDDPFVIMAGGGIAADTFIFQFCELPTWQVAVTDGALQVRASGATGTANRQSSMALASAGGCR